MNLQLDREGLSFARRRLAARSSRSCRARDVCYAAMWPSLPTAGSCGEECFIERGSGRLTGLQGPQSHVNASW